MKVGKQCRCLVLCPTMSVLFFVLLWSTKQASVCFVCQEIWSFLGVVDKRGNLVTTHVSILCHYLFSLYSLFLFAIRLPFSLRFAHVSHALCVQWSRVDTVSFTFTFKAQHNNKCYIFITLVTIRGFWYASSPLYWFSDKELLCITHTVKHNCISPSCTLGIQHHVSFLYVGHLQVVI